MVRKWLITRRLLAVLDSEEGAGGKWVSCWFPLSSSSNPDRDASPVILIPSIYERIARRLNIMISIDPPLHKSSTLDEGYSCQRPMPRLTPAWSPSPPASFPHFRLLPLEIRRQIWRLSLRPRIIDARLKSWDWTTRRPLPIEPAFDNGLAPVRAPLPSQFHVCREARDEVQRLYNTIEDSSTFYVAQETKINFDLDILYCATILYDHNVLGRDPSLLASPDAPANWFVPCRLAWDENVVSKVMRLAIVRTELHILDPCMRQVYSAVEGLQKFPSLREIILIEPEILEGHGVRLWEWGTYCRDSSSRCKFKGPVEFVEPEKWQRIGGKETALMTMEYSQMHKAMRWLRDAEAEAVSGWRAPDITYYGSVRWKDGSKSMAPSTG